MSENKNKLTRREFLMGFSIAAVDASDDPEGFARQLNGSGVENGQGYPPECTPQQVEEIVKGMSEGERRSHAAFGQFRDEWFKGTVKLETQQGLCKTTRDQVLGKIGQLNPNLSIGAVRAEATKAAQKKKDRRKKFNKSAAKYGAGVTLTASAATFGLAWVINRRIKKDKRRNEELNKSSERRYQRKLQRQNPLEIKTRINPDNPVEAMRGTTTTLQELQESKSVLNERYDLVTFLVQYRDEESGKLIRDPKSDETIERKEIRDIRTGTAGELDKLRQRVFEHEKRQGRYPGTTPVVLQTIHLSRREQESQDQENTD